MARIPKDSAYWYRDFIAAQGAGPADAASAHRPLLAAAAAGASAPTEGIHA